MFVVLLCCCANTRIDGVSQCGAGASSCERVSRRAQHGRGRAVDAHAGSEQVSPAKAVAVVRRTAAQGFFGRQSHRQQSETDDTRRANSRYALVGENRGVCFEQDVTRDRHCVSACCARFVAREGGAGMHRLFHIVTKEKLLCCFCVVVELD